MALLPFKDGSVEHIQGLDIHIPPVGFVPDYYSGTGELIKSEILFSDKPQKDQKWQRQPLPSWYNKKYQEELIQRKSNPDYRDDELQVFRKDQWIKRLCGVWFMNNGNPVYITGKHWFYLNYWKLDTGYGSYRENDRKLFYFWQYCCEDPNCGGMIEMTKRKQGKTFRAACAQFEYASRINEAKMGIQSKTGDDAKDQVYMFSIISPFKHLPDFFKPIYDTAQGAIPKTELAFRHTSVKGQEARSQVFEGELNTIIDYRNSDLKTYDGPKLRAYIGDEVLKTVLVDVYERHGVVKECCMEDGEFIGKMYYTSTVERDEEKINKKENEACENLWKDSDQNKRVDDRTITGLYRYFTPAYETIYWDEYGYPIIDKAKEYFYKERKRLEGNPKALVGHIRKNPFTPEEAFMSDSDQCPFSVMVLQDTLRLCHSLPPDSNELEVQGDFIWKEKDKEAMWVPNNINGKWFMSWLPPEVERNKVKDTGKQDENRFEPLNDERFAFGSDPVSSGKEAEHGSSSAAGAIYRKYDIHYQEDRSDTWVADYKFDPDDPNDYYEDMIIACFFFGVQIHCEKNKFDIFNHFKRRGYNKFMMTRPGNTFAGVTKLGEEQEAGTYASEPIIELYITRLKTFWAKKGHKVRHKRIIEDALKFRYSNRTKRDTTVATGFGILAVEKPYEPKVQHTGDISKFFTYKRH